jgi:hypothetical protein
MDRNAVVLALVRIAVGFFFVVFGQYKVFGSRFAADGYLSDSGTHYILWFQKGGIAEHLTKDL